MTQEPSSDVFFFSLNNAVAVAVSLLLPAYAADT